MAAAEFQPVWKQAIGESLWGKRGLIKTANLWFPLALMVSRNASGGLRLTAPVSLQIFAVVGLWSLASILANDLADWRDDRAGGKERWILHLQGRIRELVVAMLIGLGGLLIMAFGASSGSLLAYGGAVALGLLYSVRPVRFKERGLLGPLAYSLSGTLGFVLLPWVWLESDWPVLAVLAPAVMLDKWVNLHFHQVIDYEADRKSGTRTYAVLAGPERARRSLKWAACLASLSMLVALAFLTVAVPGWRLITLAAVAAIVLAASGYIWMSRRHLARASALVRELPWFYLALTYALFRIVPLILFAHLAMLEPTMWVVFGLVGVLLFIESTYAARYHYD